MREWWVLVQEQPHCHWELRIRLMSTSFPLPHYFTSPCHGYSPNPTLLSWLPPHAAAMATTELLQLVTTSETETYDSYGYGIAMEWLPLQLWLWPISDALHKATITAISAARPPSQLLLLFQQIQEYLLPQLLFLLLAACCLLHPAYSTILPLELLLLLPLSLPHSYSYCQQDRYFGWYRDIFLAY